MKTFLKMVSGVSIAIGCLFFVFGVLNMLYGHPYELSQAILESATGLAVLLISIACYVLAEIAEAVIPEERSRVPQVAPPPGGYTA
jgi:hypothetical protein